MSIYDDKHDNFRTAVIDTMQEIATTALLYSDKKRRTQYVEDSVDIALSTILNCFDDEFYCTLTDTVCRRCAKEEIYRAIELNDISIIDAESVFEDIDDMQDDE